MFESLTCLLVLMAGVFVSSDGYHDQMPAYVVLGVLMVAVSSFFLGYFAKNR